MRQRAASRRRAETERSGLPPSRLIPGSTSSVLWAFRTVTMPSPFRAFSLIPWQSTPPRQSPCQAPFSATTDPRRREPRGFPGACHALPHHERANARRPEGSPLVSGLTWRTERGLAPSKRRGDVRSRVSKPAVFSKRGAKGVAGRGSRGSKPGFLSPRASSECVWYSCHGFRVVAQLSRRSARCGRRREMPDEPRCLEREGAS